MVPAGINLADLAGLEEQLGERGVATTGHVSPEWRDAMARAVDDAERAGEGTFGVAILHFMPAHAADLRDVAQELHEATGIETVLVRAPQSGAAVSSRYPRNDLERAQDAFLGTRDYVTAVREFPEHLDDAPIPWTPVGLSVVLLCVLASLAGRLAVKR